MKYCIILLAILNSCTNPQAQIKSDFEHLFDDKFSDNDPGGIILVKKGNEIVFLKSYGVEDMETGKKIDTNTIFNTGSISKTFVSNGVLMLKEANLLSLEDSLYQYFEDFDQDDIAKKVKIKHLLSHTSGLPDSRKVDENIEFYLTAKDEENFQPIKHTKALNFEPGKQFDYSNPAYNGLALIIEKITKQKWQNFIHDKIFMPSGMTHSKITDGAYPNHGVAHAYTFEDGAFKEDDYGEYPTFAAAGNGGVWCSILDLAKYEKALRNAVFLSAKTIEISQNVLIPENWDSPEDPDVGYSWFISEKEHQSNDLGVKIISHTGWQGGFRAFYISIPEKDILYVGLFNRPISNLSESYNPFTKATENLSDVRVSGLKILQKYNWLGK